MIYPGATGNYMSDKFVKKLSNLWITKGKAIPAHVSQWNTVKPGWRDGKKKNTALENLNLW